MSDHATQTKQIMRLAGFFAASLWCTATLAQTPPEASADRHAQHENSAKKPSAASTHAHGRKTTTSAPSGRWHAREGMYFRRNWGVDIVGVHPVSSGYMLRFGYRVLDEKKAKPLNEKKAKPYLIDEATGTHLAVPALENVGELRQSPDPKADRTYFILFGNPGKLVKPGNRVSVVIGNFRVDGLVVD